MRSKGACKARRHRRGTLTAMLTVAVTSWHPSTLRCGCGLAFNDDAVDELGAPPPSSPSTKRRQASPSAGRERLVRHTHRKCRRSARPASRVLARCDPTHARAPRQHRCPSTGSPPQRCHRRSACRSSPRCQARDARPAHPTAGGRGPDALPVQREQRRGLDHRRPPLVRYPRDVLSDGVALGRSGSRARGRPITRTSSPSRKRTCPSTTDHRSSCCGCMCAGSAPPGSIQLSTTSVSPRFSNVWRTRVTHGVSDLIGHGSRRRWQVR